MCIRDRSDIKQPAFDLDGANALLDQAGYTDANGDGIREASDGTPLQFTMTYRNTLANVDSIMEILRSDFQKIGIGMDLSPVDATTFTANVTPVSYTHLAMAVINHPILLIADEPTTALDVTIQAQILDIMKKLKGTGGLVVVTHNLGIVADICEEVVVMYAGRAVERGTLKAIFDHPLHPYCLLYTSRCV